MKTLTLFLFLIGSFTGLTQIGGPEISFNKETHDYGNVAQGGNGDCEFVITNTGDKPLIISNAKGSCQCTVPTWPKDPIMPGKSEVIKVHYNTNRVGAINKSVFITSNAVNNPNATLRIKGTVTAAPLAEEK